MVNYPSFTDFASLVAEILGVPVPAPMDNFVEIGGDSLAALRLAVAAEERWGVEIDASELVFADTLRDIQASLTSSMGDCAGQDAQIGG